MDAPLSVSAQTQNPFNLRVFRFVKIDMLACCEKISFPRVHDPVASSSSGIEKKNVHNNDNNNIIASPTAAVVSIFSPVRIVIFYY